jgi:hypothetical protein
VSKQKERVMKYVCTFLSLFIIIAIGCSKKNSSPANNNQQTQSSVIFTRSLSANGNHYDTFSFPLPDTSEGILQSVNVKFLVSLYYTFTLENNADTSFNYDIKLGREDFITSSVLSTTLHDSVVKDYFYTLAASDGVMGSGTDYIQFSNLPVLQQYTAIDTLVDASLFTSENLPKFNHQSKTFGYSQNGASFTLRGSAADSVTLSLQYNYIKTTK